MSVIPRMGIYSMCASIENTRRNLKHTLIKPLRITTQCTMSGRISKGFCAKQFCSFKHMNLSVCLSVRPFTSTPASRYYRIHSHSFQFPKLPACFHLASPRTISTSSTHTPAGKWRNESSARHCLSIWTAAGLTGWVNIYLPTDNKHATCLHVPSYSPFVLNCHPLFFIL